MLAIGHTIGAPIEQNLNTPFDEEVAHQRNGGMEQQTKYSNGGFSNDGQIHGGQHRADMYEFGYNTNMPKVGFAAATYNHVTGQTQATTTETFNAANLEAPTMTSYAQAPYGNARGQLSLMTLLDTNEPGKLLPVNNSEVFDQVALDKLLVRIPQPLQIG